MRGRRRDRAQPRPCIPPSASIAPVAQHRGGNAQLACDLAQRPTAAHQQGYRFLLELIRKMTPSLAHSTPFRSRRSEPPRDWRRPFLLRRRSDEQSCEEVFPWGECPRGATGSGPGGRASVTLGGHGFCCREDRLRCACLERVALGGTC